MDKEYIRKEDLMKRLNIHSIAVKYFIVTFLLIVVPICAFFFIARESNITLSLAQKQSSDLVTLDTYAAALDTYMESVESIGKIIAHDEDIISFLASARSESAENGRIIYKSMDNQPPLSSYHRALPSLRSLSLMDADGFFIGEQNLNLDRLTYFFNKTLMREVTGEHVYWTKTFSIEFLNDSSVEKVFALLVPSHTPEGELLGYIALFVDMSKLKELLKVYSDNIYVLEGNYILASKQDLPIYTSLFSEMQISYSLLLEDSSVIIHQADDPLIVTTKSFSPLDVQLLSVSSYKVLKDNLTTTFPTLMTFTLYGILFAIVFAVVISRFQTKPVVSLKNIMNRVKDGDLSIRTHPRTKDEIAELGITFNSLLDRIQELMAQQKAQQKMKRKMELQMVQEQVKPHFLYNVLEMINSMIRCNMNQEAMKTVENLASFYRISLNNGSSIISISKEIQLIESYLCLQKMRYIEFMDYVLAFSPAIYDFSIPKLTLQPLIENAIYHGIKEKGDKGMVCVSGYLDKERIVFEVFDTGNGITEQKKQELTEAIRADRISQKEIEDHFGLASVIKRLCIHYNDQVTFHIDSSAGEYTCISISFPAQKE